jgi:hypothetical protein
MSSDGKEPRSTWQGASSTDWKQSSDQATPDEKNVSPPFSYRQEMEAPGVEEEFTDDYAATAEADEPDEQPAFTEPAATPSELIQQIGQYVMLILVPLLFGGLTALVVLPLVATGHAFVPPLALWPIVLVIILITMAQGVAVYYSSASNGMWALGTLGGLFLFLLLGCFALFGTLSTILLLALIIVSAIAIARLYLRPVAEGYVDIVEVFGKYSRTLYPGPNFLLPWERVTYSLSVGEVQWPCPRQRVQLSQDEDVVLQAVMSYQLLPEDAHLIVPQVKNWEENLHQQFMITLQTLATHFSPYDFLAWKQNLHAYAAVQGEGNAFSEGSARWEKVNDNLFQQMRDKGALWGIQINWVQIFDVALVPHNSTVVDTESTPQTQMVVEPASPVGGGGDDRTLEMEKQTVQQAMDTTHPLENPQHSLFPPEPPPVGSIPDEKILRKAYKEVQMGKITDPDTILGIAARFAAVARDPELSQKVSFDAERATENLQARAQKYRELAMASAIANDETRPDGTWFTRHPTDKNLTGGG